MLVLYLPSIKVVQVIPHAVVKVKAPSREETPQGQNWQVHPAHTTEGTIRPFVIRVPASKFGDRLMAADHSPPSLAALETIMARGRLSLQPTPFHLTIFSGLQG